MLRWLEQDVAYVQEHGLSAPGIQTIKRAHGIERFDLVLIDGSEFTGTAEMEEVYGARWLVLDDIRTLKNLGKLRAPVDGSSLPARREVAPLTQRVSLPSSTCMISDPVAAPSPRSRRHARLGSLADRRLAGLTTVAMGTGTVLALAGVGSRAVPLALAGGALAWIAIVLVMGHRWLDPMLVVALAVPLPAVWAAGDVPHRRRSADHRGGARRVDDRRWPARAAL